MALKRQRYTDTEIDLIAGAQHEADFRALNPQAMVPVLADDKIVLSQSLAIIEYLDRCFPQPPLLPSGNVERARVQQFAQIICCDMQSLTSYRVMSFLRTECKLNANARKRWFRHWLLEGLDALELWLIASGAARNYCVGDQISIADICLVPQLNIARRNGIDIDDFPRLAAIEENCLKLEAFEQACATLRSATN